MRDGRLEQVGAYADLAERPANTFVASFLGPRPMNLFAGGTAVSGIARFGELTVPLHKNLRSLVVEGQSLTAGVRPEVAWIREGAQSSPDAIRIRGTVELIEPDFARREQSIQVRTGNYTYFGVCSQDLPLRLKEEVEVAFPADAFIFFDGGSGKRIG
jgi:ABC-type sugar transport system ATPase subunit